MTAIPQEHTDTVRAAAAAREWLGTSTDILRGLNHGLGNRLYSLEMLSSTIAPGEAVDEEMVGILRSESARFERLLRLYRLLELTDREASEPMLMNDALADAQAMLAQHLELREVRCDVRKGGGGGPVLAHPASLTQALAAVLCGVARHAVAADAAMMVRTRADDDYVYIEIEAPEHADAPAPGASADAASWLLASADGEAQVERTGGAIRTTLRIPGLAAARRREREATNS